MKKIALGLGLLMLFGTACKQPKQNTKKAPTTTTKKGKPTIASKTKGWTKIDGLFTMYQDTATGSSYMVINKNQLDHEFIYFAYTENGVIQAGHFRGSYRDNEVFKIRKNYDKIEFVKENKSFYFDSTSALYKSRNANISSSILIDEAIVASDRDSLYLISADKIFLSEQLSRVKPPMLPIPGAGFRFALGGLNPKKTRYRSIRGYNQNTDVVVEYVYDNPNAFVSGGNEVTDPRSVSIVYQHSFLAMPEENGFIPRKDDPRVGFFSEQVDDMTSYSATPYKDVIHRWNLVKKDPTAALSDPVKPITWWIENTTPIEYRETIRDAALTWNKAFLKAGFTNAIEVKIQPDTADWDAGDIRYNVLRWTSSPTPPFGGYGPSFVNPRTGEILGADIMLEFVFLTNRLRQFDVFTTAGMAFTTESFEPVQFPQIANPHQCMAGELIQHNTMLGMAQLNAIDADDKEKDRFIKSAIHYLILHEMGHTMGLMHNMKASNLWMPDDIHNAKKTEELGLIGSVMDYPAVNINPNHAQQGDYYTSQPGPYDLWAIEYAYSPALSEPNQEDARLNKILARSTEHALMFGNDADDMRSPGKGIDPRVMIFDISGDAVQYSYDRINMLNASIPKLKAKYSKEGEGFNELLSAYLTVTGEIGNATSVMSRYIGGVYVERSVVGQPNAKTPYTPVPEDYQKKAMKYLSETLFAPDAFKASEGLYNTLQRQRRGFNFFVNTEDPKIYERALRMQQSVLVHILHPNTLDRVSNSELYGNTYSPMDIMSDLETAIFAADLKASVNTFRANLQMQYVEFLIFIAGLEKESYHNPSAQAAAYATLTSIQKNLRANQLQGNAETRAHRSFLLYSINKAFEGK
ncbi:MAG: DUF5117 domain-containing protein [Bacteroidetes bacterium]|nr:DUF5117 domain-containing protein [Bacteroidota bacterium]